MTANFTFHHNAITYINFIMMLFWGVAVAYLLLGKRKSATSRYLLLFFSFFLAQAVAVYLAQGWVAYGWIFVPWQTALSLMSGPFLIQFIYTFPVFENSRRRRVLLGLTSVTALLALIFVINHYIARAMGRNVLSLQTQPLIYLTAGAAIGIMLVLLRHTFRSGASQSVAERFKLFFRPNNPTSWMMRDLTLAFSLAVIPVLSNLLPLAYNTQILVAGIGSLLVTAAILLVYLTHSYEAATLVVKVIGITFFITLTALSWFGIHEIELVEQHYQFIRQTSVAQLRMAIANDEDQWASALPNEASFLLRWGNVDQVQAQQLPNIVYQDERTLDEPSPTDYIIWDVMLRSITQPTLESGVLMIHENGYLFMVGDVLWQVGFFNSTDQQQALNALVNDLQRIILIISAIILGSMYLFLRLHLALPVRTLVAGVQQVEQGELETAVPVTFADEIGNLTAAFNRMAETLYTERRANDQLTAELQTTNQNLNDEIEDRVRLESLLIYTEKLRTAGQLTASLTHEINNPLQTVVGCLALASEAIERENDPSEYLAVSRTALKRVADTMHRMRNLYVSSSATRQLCDVNALFEDIFLLLRRKLDKQNIQLDWQPASELAVIPLDTAQIQQVLLNLVLNSAEAMPNGGTLRITTNTTLDGITIAVADTGAGISAAELPHIFDPFFTTKMSGLGLGLAISHAILEQHGGTIKVKSHAHHGTTFKIWLPRQPTANSSSIQSE